MTMLERAALAEILSLVKYAKTAASHSLDVTRDEGARDEVLEDAISGLISAIRILETALGIIPIQNN